LEKNMAKYDIYIKRYMKEDPLPTLKGSNSCKAHNLRIKVDNV
jgi:hypothetical protein